MPERLHTAEGHRQGQNWSASENPFRVNSRPAKRKRGAGASALLLFQDHLLLPRVREAEAVSSSSALALKAASGV